MASFFGLANEAVRELLRGRGRSLIAKTRFHATVRHHATWNEFRGVGLGYLASYLRLQAVIAYDRKGLTGVLEEALRRLAPEVVYGIFRLCDSLGLTADNGRSVISPVGADSRVSASGLTSSHTSSPPRTTSLYLEITGRCNMACPMCMTRDHRKDGGPELGRQRIREELLVPCRNAGMIDFVISGGEATLCPHLLETIEDAKELGFSVQLATNLLVMDEQLFSSILRLLDEPRHAVQISFDSLRRSEMRAIRGADVYDRVLANCRALLQLRRKLDGKATIRSVTVIQSENLDSVEDTVKFLLNDLQFDWVSVQPRSDYSSVTLQNFRKQPFPAYSEQARSAFIAKVFSLFRLAGTNPRLYMVEPPASKWIGYFTDPLSLQGPCKSTKHIYVDAFGNIRGCLCGEILGSLNQVRIDSFLESKEYLDFRRLPEVCKICIHGCS